MESDLTQSALFYKLWAWGERNRKQLLYGLIALVVVGIIVAFVFAHGNEKQKDANAALATLTSQMMVPPGTEPTADAYLKVHSDYADTEAGQRALLLAAGSLFSSGKYDVAMAQFQKFLQDYNSSPLAGQAALGIASCYDAMGKTNDAVSGYQGVIDRYPSQNVFAQAKLRLGSLLEAQGKYRDARAALEDVARSLQGTILGSEAMTQLQALNAAHPEVQTPAPAAATAPSISAPVATPAVSAPKAPAAAAAPSTNKIAK